MLFKSKVVKIIIASIVATFSIWMFITSVYYLLTEQTFMQTATSLEVQLSMLIGGWYPALLVSYHIHDNY